MSPDSRMIPVILGIGRDRPLQSNEIANSLIIEHWRRYTIEELVPGGTYLFLERQRFRSRGREFLAGHHVPGATVKAVARGMDIGITLVGPLDEARHGVEQGLA